MANRVADQVGKKTGERSGRMGVGDVYESNVWHFFCIPIRRVGKSLVWALPRILTVVDWDWSGKKRP
jgi:hypothetical protein